MKMVNLLALRTGRLYPLLQEKFLVLISVKGLRRTQEGLCQ